MASEKRSYRRLPAAWTIQLTWEGGRASGQTENLTLGGAMVTLAAEPDIGSGTPVDATLDLPSGRSIALRGRVAWVSSVLPGLVGIEFGGETSDPFSEAIDGLEILHPES